MSTPTLRLVGIARTITVTISGSLDTATALLVLLIPTLRISIVCFNYSINILPLKSRS